MIDAILIVVFLAIISFGVGLALRTVDQNSMPLICTVEIPAMREEFSSALRAGSVLRDESNTFDLGIVTTANTPSSHTSGYVDVLLTVSIYASLTDGSYQVNGLPISIGNELNFRTAEIAVIDCGAIITKIQVMEE